MAAPVPTGPARIRPAAATGPALRPDPVLAIGIAGDGALDLGEEAARHLHGAASRLFEELLDAAGRVVARDPDLFAPLPLRLRAVTRLADGADLTLCAAARDRGAEIRAILPDGLAACAVAPGRGAGPLFAELLDAAPDPFTPGGEPGRAATLERAGDALLDRSDILVAVWSGSRDGPGRNREGRGGVAALVQRAVERRMPVLLLPTGPGERVSVVADPDELLLPAIAEDLPRIDFAANVERVLERAFAPPSSDHEKRALRDCLGEPATSAGRRIEYRALLALAGGPPAQASRAPQDGPDPGPDRTAGPDLAADAQWRRARDVAGLASPGAADVVARLDAIHDRLDALAAFYGNRVRSGIVLRYAMAALGALLVAVFAIVAPQFGLAWLVVQGVITGVAIGEASYATRRRWNERWLDYRSLAERLRCDRFLAPLGISTARLDVETSAEDPAWMRWCHVRLLRGWWIGGEITPASIEAARGHLVAVEIAAQARYHAATTARFTSLGRRLRQIEVGAVACTLGATLLLLALASAGLSPAGLEAVLKIALITLPAVFLASRGLRAEMGLELAAARSEGAAASLAQVVRRLDAAPPGFDRLAQASLAAAGAMILDTVDWRVGLQRSRSPYLTRTERRGPG